MSPSRAAASAASATSRLSEFGPQFGEGAGVADDVPARGLQSRPRVDARS
jgi:hypothetical protein